MKKLTLLIAIIAVMFTACKKDNEQNSSNQNSPKITKTVSGTISLKAGDIIAKDLPAGVDHSFAMFKKDATGGTYSLLDGTIFIAGSAPAVFWGASAPNANNPAPFTAAQVSAGIVCNYTPVTDVKVVILGKIGNDAAYLGIKNMAKAEIIPNFVLNVRECQLKDVLTIDATQLANIPGYSFSVKADYILSRLDVDAMIQTNDNTTNNRPAYVYKDAGTVGSLTALTNQVYTQAVNGSKFLGDANGMIKVTCTVTNTASFQVPASNFDIVFEVPASDKDNFLKVVLSTTKTGWNDSGQMGLSSADISATTVYTATL